MSKVDASYSGGNVILILTGGSELKDLEESSRELCDEILLSSLVEEAG